MLREAEHAICPFHSSGMRVKEEDRKNAREGFRGKSHLSSIQRNISQAPPAVPLAELQTI